MNLRGLIAVWLLGLSQLGVAAVDNTPIVRVEVVPDVVSVGEPAMLRVTVLSPTWFPKAPLYPSFELPNAITRLPPDSTYPTSARVNQQTWSGIVREYQIYPLLGAEFLLSDDVVVVTYADPDTSRPVKIDVPVPPITLRAVVPTGAEGISPYVAGSLFTLKREIEGDPRNLAPGDALVLRYVAQLDGLPVMFLPSLLQDLLPIIETEGVSVYADAPLLTDGNPGTRTEQVTLVFEAGGEFNVPELTLDWWNTKTSMVERESLPSLDISVLGPAINPSTPESQRPRETRYIIFALLAGFVLVYLGWRGITFLTARLKRLLEDRRASEKFAFDALINALGKKDLQLTYSLLGEWLHKCEPNSTAIDFARQYGDADLETQIGHLSSTLFAGAADVVDWRVLRKTLVIARNTYRHTSVAAGEMLPPLNP